jgi:RND family efflux transporter MFP subunit
VHPENASVSKWTDASELFMEYPPLVKGESARFLIHLTNLRDFSAVKNSPLTIDIYQGEVKVLSHVETRPSREGIYTPDITLNTTGYHTMVLSLSGDEIRDTIRIDSIRVYAKAGEIAAEHHQSTAAISFLKEQQWKIDFSTQPVHEKSMHGSISVTGVILPLPRNLAKIISPFEGMIHLKNNGRLLSLGTYVRQGERLLVISPSADAGANILALKKEFLIAEAEFQRAQELYEQRAIPKKRLTEARLEFEAKRASYQAVSEQVDLSQDDFALVAPIDGYIEKINFILGDRVEAGQELFLVSNPERIMLRADVPESQIQKAMETEDASFLVSGLDTLFNVTRLHGKKTSVGSTVDAVSHTIPVFFELNNWKNRIKIGMHAQVFLSSGAVRTCLAVPKASLIDEDGNKTLYLQSTGESFEKRIVRTGLEEGGFVEITQGVRAGERVVVKGAYQVRLASLGANASMGHGHVH